MGDLITNTTKTSLSYVGLDEYEKCWKITDFTTRVKLFASLNRINIIYMIARAGSGHIGSSFSSIDIMSFLELLKAESTREIIYFSSKGHDAPALYAVWIGNKKLEFQLLHKLRRLNGLPGHPDVSIPNVVANTGSLGMGVSKAKGMILGDRLNGDSRYYYVITGDGELQEGQFWEFILSSVNNNMYELTIIVDHNKLQSDSYVRLVNDLGDLEGKFRSFGFEVDRIDGHNVHQLVKVIKKNESILDRPKVIIADTIKGCGVSFMEHTSLDSDVEYYKFHSGAPNSNNYINGLHELTLKANRILIDCGLSELELKIDLNSSSVSSSSNELRLIPEYSKILIEEASDNERILALDADLILDTGLLDFKKRFPMRFIECGIAEQDMVLMAGALARKGFLPIVHSFSCFLSSRPNEQIYNNSTENSKIVYVGSLAGVLPAGPGHSHQAVRDIAALRGIPNLIIVEPSSEEELRKLLHWAINFSTGSVYIRLVSIPFKSYFVHRNLQLEVGVGSILKEGSGLTIITHGPAY